MSKTTTIAGLTFPAEIRPGAEIAYVDPTQLDPFEVHHGTVWDRAPQGGEQGYSSRPWEKSGTWLWVIPEGDRRAVRVRVPSKGKGRPYVDDSPYVVRTTNGLQWSHEHAAMRITRDGAA